jgi:serine/threonine protein kinase
MSLAAGVRLGVYEIVELVGSGGMGEVYRARDPRLGRDVAIKVLPAAFSTDEERLRRFEQEARAAAALNHPNILAVYDIGTGDGAPYVVSELLEGETLRDRLNAGGLPARKAIAVTVQIAHGLAAAHGKGIVHRDLKPENVFLVGDGRAKILDFGLAKLTEREPAVSGLTALPTTPPDTLPGVVLGTIGYMSPEQVRGLPADHRSDIFSFGTILYELLSGQRAFRGETSADTMTAILKEDPPDLPSTDRRLPPALARIVDRCLEKAPAARFQSAEDLAFALEALSSGDSGAAEAMAGASSHRSARLPWMLAAVSAALALTAATWAVVQRSQPQTETRALRFMVAPPEGWNVQLSQSSGSASQARFAPLTVSPDGRQLAFIAGGGTGGQMMLWLRALDSLTPRSLPGTEGAASPFWSPDSRSLAFFSGGKLKRVDTGGGSPVMIADAPNGVGGAWSGKGTILVAQTNSVGKAGMARVPAAGGGLTPAEAFQPSDRNHTRPNFMPDGVHFIFSIIGEAPYAVYAASLDAPGERKKILDSDSTNVIYSRGHLLFLRGSTLVAQPFDVRTLTTTGDVFPVAEQIRTQSIGGSVSGIFAASDNGVLAYQTGPAQGTTTQLMWVDRTGRTIETVGERGEYADVELSPDCRQSAVSVLDRTQFATVGLSSDVWLVDLARGARTRLTSDPAADSMGIWSPDSTQLVFASQRRGGPKLYRRPANGTGADELLVEDDFVKMPVGWSADGKYIVYYRAPNGAPADASMPAEDRAFWAIPAPGGKPFPVLASRFLTGAARLSHDARWLAYVSTESGRSEVYVTPFPGPGGKTLVSTAGGVLPRWRHDGKEIFYRALPPDARMMSAAVSTSGSTLEVGAAKPLFSAVLSPFRYAYDVSADGTRFLLNAFSDLTAASGSTQSQVTVVVNWPAAAGHEPR